MPEDDVRTFAVVATHPVQYQVPLWRAMARSGRLGIKVFYATRHGLEASDDPGFGARFAWDIPLLDGYDHEFVPSARLPWPGGPVACHYPRGLARRLSQTGSQAVLVSGYASAASWAGLAAAWRLDLPVLMVGDTHEHGRSPSWRRSLKKLLLPFVLDRIDGFLAVGSWNEQYWRAYGVPERKIARAIFAVDHDRFAAESQRQEPVAAGLRVRWRADETDPVYLAVARFVPEKALDLLLRAFATLAHPRAHLVCVGSGPLAPALKDLERELGVGRVHWEGFVNQSRLPAHYRAADVLVLPSRAEAWGLVVNEAMACGTPCIVSDVVGAGADLIDGHDTGIIFRRGDESALVSALRVAADAGVRARWRQNIAAALARSSLSGTQGAIESLLARTARRGTIARGGRGPTHTVQGP